MCPVAPMTTTRLISGPFSPAARVGPPGVRLPLRAGVVRIAGATADGHHFVAAAHQPRDEVTADVPGSSDDNDATHLRPFQSGCSGRSAGSVPGVISPDS